ncbi:DUF3192 domain-containing protein [Thalassotalea sp. ND16A]|uniref:DUF3192 domain-containing protein n=1 Tax=Thalassotalea sp. ND16A TaxID=1535422 RepID=UPI00051A0DC2|nr:DUF3192 domain-containing protein [Thalassotalea sp. ND16A]KGJ90548.1 hypothetical protein ND16A_1944 [Thalassotalea sp. ND16A]
MKKSLAALMLIAPLTLGLTGCIVVADGDGDFDRYVSDHEDREYENRKKMARLVTGMSFNDAQDHFGVPDFNESYEKGGETIQVLYYRTNRKHGDGMTTKDECTPLVFKDSKLVSWGESAYKQL